ncbi:MAG TPA: amino acid permease [Candidatus Aquilonibacter sp.]|nr:amino acid permease [Candidatus Aquilonibacter sp.]
MQPAQPNELPRVLTARHALAIVVGIVIGSGIFLVPREMMAATGRVSIVYVVWIIGGLLSLFGAMSYAEVAALRPRVGGEYAFIREAYGDLPAFLYTWTWVTIAKPASIATLAAGLMRVLGDFSALSFLTHPASAHLRWSPSWGQLAAILATWLITALNIVSTRESANVQTALTWLKILLIVGIAVVCFASLRHGSLHNLATTYLGAHAGLTGFMTALIAALWAYDGWSDVSQLAGEVIDPQRSMPLALIGGVFIVAALYILIQTAIQYILPAALIAVSDRPAADALRVVAGSAGAALVSVGMAISICATLVGSSLSGARVPFAAARDRLFPRSLAAIHPRFHTPSASLILQAILSSLLLLVIGKYQALFSLAIVSEWLFYALTTSTVFVFRHRDPGVARPYSVNGYPVTPMLFILSALMIIVFSFVTEPRNSIGGAVVILLGVPLYWWMKSQHRSA